MVKVFLVSKMRMPPVSVIVITKNEERNIADCLNSLKNIDYPEFEVVVVDSSDDNTPEIARKYHNVRVVTTKEAGFAQARNVGMNIARNKIVAFTDADCIVPENWLRVLVPHLKDGVAAAGGAAYPPKDADYLGKCIACLGLPAGGTVGPEILKIISTCNGVFLKSAIDDAGKFDERMIHGMEDGHLSEKMKARGYKIKIVPESFVYHKTRKGLEFLKWSVRRGRARFYVKKNPVILLSPLSVIFYPMTKKFGIVAKKRREIGLGVFTIYIVIPALFFVKQVMMSIGWIIEFVASIRPDKRKSQVV